MLATIIGVIADLLLFNWHKQVIKKTLLQSVTLEMSKAPLGMGLALLFIDIALSLFGYQYDDDFQHVAEICFMFGCYLAGLSMSFTTLAMVLRRYNYFEMNDPK